MDASRSGAGSALQLRVGAFVLASLLVFVGLVYMLGRSAGLFERQYRLVASFSQIGGLIQGATVRLAGVPVGRVGTVRLPEAGSNKVQVDLLIARRVQDRIRADSVARIETLGLLGDKIIDVSLGSPSAAVLPDGAELRTEEPFDTARLTQQGAELLRNLVDLSGELRTALAGITGSSAGERSIGWSMIGSSVPRSPTRARRCGRSARPCAASTGRLRIPRRPISPARRGGPSPRRARPRSG
jgi:ABC-type transporter Mla subunit MlaD